MSYTLPYKSLQFLRDCLMSNGWNADEKDSPKLRRKRAYNAGVVLDTVLPDVEDPTTPPSKAVGESNPQALRDYVTYIKTFNSAPTAAFDLTAEQLEAVQACLGFCIEHDAIPKGTYLNVLMETFKLVP